MTSACLKKERGCVEDQPQHAASASTRRKFEACCGWSRTTQPRSGVFRQALRFPEFVRELFRSSDWVHRLANSASGKYYSKLARVVAIGGDSKSSSPRGTRLHWTRRRTGLSAAGRIGDGALDCEPGPAHTTGRMAGPNGYCRTRDRFEMIRPT